ncbi:MAG: polyphosphate polymerase domain-containing protein [Firmicutes bacterium]|nr:polyphosphate polymerase domain-containing protein [Candidatus Colivicinus equi]
MSLYRNEWKYYLNEPSIKIIENKLDKVLRLDEHTGILNKYLIHSLYFDDYTNSCKFDNDAGLGKRYKWRIRYYDDDLSYITLEKKEKLNSLCKKRSCKLTLEQYYDIINNNISQVLWNTDNKLLKEFCIEVMTRRFRPKVIIDYERTAYVEPITNVRITFDRNISASLELNKFITGGYTRTPLLPKDRHILEVKFNDILPSYIKQATHIKDLQQHTFSKYYLSRSLLERN